jgi:Bacterial SH3 domain
LTLLGALQAFATPDQVPPGLEALRQALRQQPNDGKLRNLVAMAELKQCCAADGAGPALEQVPQMLLAGLAVDPNNTDLLANLETTYAWLSGQPAGELGEPVALATGVARVNANLRAGPNTDAPVVGLAQRGSRIRVTGIVASGQWLRVDRGAEPDAFVAARLVQDLEPAGLECGRDIAPEICAALRAGVEDGHESKLPELFRTLEGAQTGTGAAIPSRLAAAGLTAAEVDARLAEVNQLRHALGQMH